MMMDGWEWMDEGFLCADQITSAYEAVKKMNDQSYNFRVMGLLSM